MNPHIASLKAWMAEKAPEYGYEHAHTLLEHLWYSYTEYNPIENLQTNKLFAELEPIFDALPDADSSLLFDHICELCLEFQRSTFLEGIHIGFRLASELASDRS